MRTTLNVTSSPGKRDNVAYVFLLPWLIGFVTLTLGPVLASFYFSLTNYDLLSAPRFIGVANFTNIFSDPYFWTSLKVTLTYVAISVPLRLIVALLVAALVNKPIRGMSIYRALIYLPSLLGGSVGTAIGWQALFSQNGPINQALGLVGILGPIWLGNPNTALLVIILMTVWQFGSEMVVFMAGMKQIPVHLYEASVIDGAGPWTRFTKITLPILTPIIFFNLVMGTINSFMVFTQVYVITDGGPLNATLVYVLYLYEQGFQYFHMGYAAALAVLLFILIAIFTGVFFLTSRWWVKYDLY
ncbi:MAG: sugar ABC transporter permease [Alicyclobacillus sp.]|nr:sugar ABC transporter permease [Alicyclobacillus sp.]